MKKSLITSIVAAALGSTMLFGQAQAATWKYAFEEAMEDVQGQFAQKFKEHVEANSDHEVQLFPYGTLGESADTMEQAQAGILQFVDQSPGFTGSLIPEAQVFFVPYLLPQDQDALARFFKNSEAIHTHFKDLYAENGLHLLEMFPEGEMAMTTKEPLESCSDLNEVKFRVMTNPLLVESYQAFGATPTPLPWGEVYGALQTNIIQGQENPAFWLYSTGLYEVINHITYTGHNQFTTAVMANKEFYDGLDGETQSLIEDAADAAFEHTVEWQKMANERELEKIRNESDVTITRLSPEQQECFRESAQRVEDKFIEMTGDSGKQILEQMKQDLEEATSGS
ncbi:MAG: TRAP transporter substrate-binding protein DctP [Gammaproteobacteria bacterium]|nr:TRAP transporter substrate-binding protein DctP [Gammaproteobacteria bacterium]